MRKVLLKNKIKRRKDQTANEKFDSIENRKKKKIEKYPI